MRVTKAGGKEQAPGNGYEWQTKVVLLGCLPAPASAAAAAYAPACCYRRNAQPGAYAEKLFTAAGAGRANTLAVNGCSAPRCAPPAALAAPGAGVAARLRARGRETPPAGGTATPEIIRQE